MLRRDPKKRITAAEALGEYIIIFQIFGGITFPDQCLFHGYFLDMMYFSLVWSGGKFSGNACLVTSACGLSKRGLEKIV